MMNIFLILHGTTLGQARSDQLLRSTIAESSGARATTVPTEFIRLPGRLRRQPFIDLAEAYALRRSLRRAERRHGRPEVYVLPTTTAALLQPKRVLRRSAVRFDALACENRSGRAGRISRWLERRYMKHVGLLLPYSRLPLPSFARHDFYPGRTIVPFPSAVDVGIEPSSDRQRGLVVAYCSSPYKKGLDLVLRAWERLESPSAELRVVGITKEAFDDFVAEQGIIPPASVSVTGPLPHSAFIHLLQHAHVYLASARYEDFGIAPLEAMAAGAVVVTASTPGPFEAGWLLREFAPEFFRPLGATEDLADAVDLALTLSSERLDELSAAGRAAVAPYSTRRLSDEARRVLVPALRRLGARSVS